MPCSIRTNPPARRDSEAGSLYDAPDDKVTTTTTRLALMAAAALAIASGGTEGSFGPGGPIGDDLVERVEWTGYTDWWYLGENIGAGSTTPAQVVQGWMDSDGHCANVMSQDFTEIGVGYARVNGSTWTHYWTQDFGRPQQ